MNNIENNSLQNKNGNLSIVAATMIWGLPQEEKHRCFYLAQEIRNLVIANGKIVGALAVALAAAEVAELGDEFYD